MWIQLFCFCLFPPKTKQKVAFARLEYCECNIANFPQVKGKWTIKGWFSLNPKSFSPLAFIRGDKHKKFTKFNIKFVRGITPILKLLDDKHNVIEELNIQKWDTDTIEEFLNAKLDK